MWDNLIEWRVKWDLIILILLKNFVNYHSDCTMNFIVCTYITVHRVNKAGAENINFFLSLFLLKQARNPGTLHIGYKSIMRQMRVTERVSEYTEGRCMSFHFIWSFKKISVCVFWIYAKTKEKLSFSALVFSRVYDFFFFTTITIFLWSNHYCLYTPFPWLSGPFNFFS